MLRKVAVVTCFLLTSNWSGRCESGLGVHCCCCGCCCRWYFRIAHRHSVVGAGKLLLEGKQASIEKLAAITQHYRPCDREPSTLAPPSPFPATATACIERIAPPLLSPPLTSPSPVRARPRHILARTPVRLLACSAVNSTYSPAQPKRLIIARRSEETSAQRRQAEDHRRAGTLSTPVKTALRRRRHRRWWNWCWRCCCA